MGDVKLLPCPRCGGQIGLATVDGWCKFNCVSCGLSYGYAVWDWEQSELAIAAWNTRTAPALTPKQAAADEMFDALKEVDQYMRDIVETRKNGDLNNWNGYYVPLFEKLADKYAAILAKAGRP